MQRDGDIDPIQRQEIDFADESHHRDIMGFNDDPDSFDIQNGFDDDDFRPHDEDDNVGDFVDYSPDNPNVLRLPSSYNTSHTTSHAGLIEGN